MGLLKYRACSNQSSTESSYACASPQEMADFLESINLRLKIERVRTDVSPGRTIANLVLYFDPFPVKYLNYIKKYNPKAHPGGKNTPFRHTGESIVYVQLFRLRGGSAGDEDDFLKQNVVSHLRNNNGWGLPNWKSQSRLWNARGYQEISGWYDRSCVYETRNNHRSRIERIKYVRHRHILSPQDAARGYAILLYDFTPVKSWKTNSYSRKVRLIDIAWADAYENEIAETKASGKKYNIDYSTYFRKSTMFDKAVAGGFYFCSTKNDILPMKRISNRLEYEDFQCFFDCLPK